MKILTESEKRRRDMVSFIAENRVLIFVVVVTAAVLLFTLFFGVLCGYVGIAIISVMVILLKYGY